MDFWNYITIRDTCKRSGAFGISFKEPEQFYRELFADAVAMRSAQFHAQAHTERNWEQVQRPYYNVWPSIVPILTRLSLDLDSSLIQLPLPSLCIRFPRDPAKNLLRFEWQGERIPVRCIMLSEIGEGKAISVLIDIGEVVSDEGIPIYTYRNFPREKGLKVEDSLAGLSKGRFSELGIQMPDDLVTDCVRLCCTLCLLENDPEIISPDMLADDRAKFDETGDQRFVEKAHRRGKVGWDVGRRIEVIPHYRRPHMMLAWTGAGRAVPKIVSRRGSVVHRNVVEKVPSGFEEEVGK
jgi:hypothetical protein